MVIEAGQVGVGGNQQPEATLPIGARFGGRAHALVAVMAPGLGGSCLGRAVWTTDGKAGSLGMRICFSDDLHSHGEVMPLPRVHKQESGIGNRARIHTQILCCRMGALHLLRQRLCLPGLGKPEGTPAYKALG